MKTFLSVLIVFFSSPILLSQELLHSRDDSPLRVQYNNPDILPDLGVGLWAWPLPMDFDNDGDNDLIVSCPDKPFNGLYFFENPTGSNTLLPVFNAPVKIGPGLKNLQVSHINNEPRVLDRGVEYENFKKNLLTSSEKIYPAEEIEKEFAKFRFSQWKYVDYEGDGDLDIIVGIDEWGGYGWDNAFDSLGNWKNEDLHGYLFLLENVEGKYQNTGKITAGGQPIDVYGAPSPNMEDFDNDGDLDLICGEFLDRFTWFENIGTRSEPEFTGGQFLQNSEGIIVMDLEMIIPSAIDWDKDGDIDIVAGDEDGRVAILENTGREHDNMPEFASPVYFKQQPQYLKFGALVTPCSVDWDEDGDEDLICGNSAGYIGFIENLDGGNPPRWSKPRLLEVNGVPIRIMAGENGSIQGPAEKKWGYTTLCVADWDQDGLKDIVVNSILGKIEWYKNTGTKTSPSLAAPQPVIVAWEDKIPKPAWNWWTPGMNELVTQWRTTPYVTDWNNDGLNDLIILDHEGYLAYFEKEEKDGTYQLKPGEKIFLCKKFREFDSRNNPKISSSGWKQLFRFTPSPLRLNYKEAGASGRRKISFADWDMDGDPDLLVNSTNIAWFENIKSKNDRIIFKFRGDILNAQLAGHTTSPTIVDWNRDNVPDLLIGAEDGHFYYYERPLKDDFKQSNLLK